MQMKCGTCEKWEQAIRLKHFSFPFSNKLGRKAIENETFYGMALLGLLKACVSNNLKNDWLLHYLPRKARNRRKTTQRSQTSVERSHLADC